MASRRSARLLASGLVSKENISTSTAINGSHKVATIPTGKKRKVPPVAKDDHGESDDKQIINTPKKARQKPPPETPTPAAASIMAVPYNSESNPLSGIPPLPKNRLADPLSTNAPLVSPATSRVVASTRAESASPSKLGPSKFKTTTRSILDEACTHLVKTEPKLKVVIEKHPCHVFSAEGLAEEIDPFNSLASGIMGQQVCSCIRSPHEISYCFAGHGPTLDHMSSYC
jgi:DNA-3-methyladenine glycosylase II